MTRTQRRLSKAALLATTGLMFAAPAFAQQPQAPSQKPAAEAAPKPGEKQVEGVTVTAAGDQPVRTSIDRRSYSLGRDLQATGGSIADALRGVPSVNVDVQGNVSLRGDPNVTIMIDGKPSGMFKGPNAGQMLQQLQASQFERVEVMTNPSAAYSPEGTAGIINLISKQQRGVGLVGSARGNVGTGGRYNGGVAAAYNGKALTFSADAGWRHDAVEGTIDDTRSRLDATSGRFIDSRQHIGFDSGGDSRNVRAALDYDPDKKTHMGVELRFNDMVFDSSAASEYRGLDASGALVRRYRGQGGGGFSRATTGVTGNWKRKFAGDEHDLTVTLTREWTRDGQDSLSTTFDQFPAASDYREQSHVGDELVQTRLKAEYRRPIGEGKLVAGYEGQRDENDYDNLLARGPVGGALTPDAGFTNRFRYEQGVDGLYATWQQPIGDLTVLGGLRVEHAKIDTDQVTSHLTDGYDYTKLYPSLHLQWKLNDTQQLTASYSKRIQRPAAQDLNPYRIYQDPYTRRQGNPRLRPQETDSFELGWQKRHFATYYLATLFYRQATKGVTDVVQDLGGGVLLTTKENLGESRSGGLELVAVGPLTKKLSYTISGNAFWNEIDAHNLGFAGKRSDYSVSGYAALNWNPTPKDFVQVSGFARGKQLTPQGYREPTGMLNFGWRHKLTDKWSSTVIVQDALKSFGDTLVVDTPTLRTRREQTIDLRAAYVGLTYSFGGKGPGVRRPRDPGFDFQTGGAGAPM